MMGIAALHPSYELGGAASGNTRMAADIEIPDSGHAAQTQVRCGAGSAAQTKMKALVMSRLLMGGHQQLGRFREGAKDGRPNYKSPYCPERFFHKSAAAIASCRRRSKNFIARNFVGCKYAEIFARLCDAVEIGVGISLQLG